MKKNDFVLQAKLRGYTVSESDGFLTISKAGKHKKIKLNDYSDVNQPFLEFHREFFGETKAFAIPEINPVLDSSSFLIQNTSKNKQGKGFPIGNSDLYPDLGIDPNKQSRGMFVGLDDPVFQTKPLPDSDSDNDLKIPPFAKFDPIIPDINSKKNKKRGNDPDPDNDISAKKRDGFFR